MKKTLLFGALVLLGFAVVFTGCQQPVFEEKTSKDSTSFTTLPAPNEVNATVYGPTGVIRVSWDPVPDASSYDLYRRSVDNSIGGGGTVVQYIKNVIAPAGGSISYDLNYDDVVAFDNTFKTDVEYTYKVVVKYPYATSESTDSWLKDSVFDVIVQNNSRNSNTVSFDHDGDNGLLAQGAALAKPANTKVDTYVKYSTTSLFTPSEYVQMSWDTLPGVRYLVRYSYGAGEAAAHHATGLVTFVDTSNLYGRTRDASAFPLIGGKSTLELVAQHNSINTTDNKAYYLPSEVVTEPVNTARTLLPTTSVAFAAALSNDGSYRVKLSWNDLPEATGYEVYRFSSTSSTYTTGGYMFDSWKDITSEINMALQVNNASPFRQWVGYDTASGEANQYFFYMLIAKSEKGRSLPVMSIPLTNYINLSPNLTVPGSFTWNTTTQAYNPVKISWDAIPGASYEIYRIAAAKHTVSAVTTVDGNYELIAATTLPSPNPTNAKLIAVVDDTAEFSDTPETRKAYRYKVIAKLGTASGEAFIDLVRYPYISGQVNVNASFNNTPIAAADGVSEPAGFRRGAAYQIAYQLTAANVPELLALMKDTDRIRISRKLATNGGYTEIASIPKASVNATQRIYDAGVGTYDYIAEVVASDGTVFTTSGTQTGGSNLTPSYEASFSIALQTVGSNIRFTQSGNGTTYKNEYYYGTELRISYVDVPTIHLANASTILAEAIAAGTAVKQNLSLSRDASTNINLYFTADIANNPAVNYTRYGKLERRDAGGNWSNVAGYGNFSF